MSGMRALLPVPWCCSAALGLAACGGDAATATSRRVRSSSRRPTSLHGLNRRTRTLNQQIGRAAAARAGERDLLRRLAPMLERGLRPRGRQRHRLQAPPSHRRATGSRSTSSAASTTSRPVRAQARRRGPKGDVRRRSSRCRRSRTTGRHARAAPAHRPTASRSAAARRATRCDPSPRRGRLNGEGPRLRRALRVQQQCA